MQVREVGWRLYAKGGRDGMVTACALLETLIDGTRFLSFIDHAWNGIGFTDDPRGVWVT
jgi:hypothetical protein